MERALNSVSMTPLVLLVVVATGCPEEEQVTLEPPGPAVPGEMRTVEVTDDKIETGRALYTACVPCHGEERGGKVGQGPSLNSETFLAAASDDFLIRTITYGRPGTTMVAWGTTMEDSEIEALVAFLRSDGEVEPAELDESPLEGDVAAGEEIYGQICSACHGRTGAGYMETANGTGIGREAFLDSATNGYLRYVIKHGKSDTPMRGFAGDDPVAVANLDDDEIENVIAYLRDHAW